jgi:type I restriction enzyme M protein
MTITTLVKCIQDIMRQDAGVDGDAQRISQLVWMLFLKIFDAKEDDWEILDDNYKSIIPEKLRWRNWAADDEGITGDTLLDFVNEDLFKTMKSLPVNETTDKRARIVRDIFEDSYNYMKSGTLMRQVINKLNQIDFSEYADRHAFNDLYENILRDLQSAGNAGEFYTPRPATGFIIDALQPKLGEKVADLACGTGGFLVCALEHMYKQVVTVQDREVLQNSLFGIEKKPLPHLLAMTNLILHDIDAPNIRRDNSLTRNVRDIRDDERFDVIAMNPPFGGIEEDGIATNFPQAFRAKETADLFMVRIMYSLKQGGRAGVILPDGFLFGEGVKTNIKEKLLAEFNLHTIVRLPNGVFAPYTDINTNILFFTKGEPTKEVWFFEHPLPEGYKKYNKTKPLRIEEFKLEKRWGENRVENEYAWKVSVEEIKARNYNLDYKNPSKVLENSLKSSAEIMADLEKSIVKSNQVLSEIKGIML